MKRDQVLKELNESAIESARLEKKFRQVLFHFLVSATIIIIGQTLIYSKIIPSYNGASLTVLYIVCILTVIAGGIVLPFGKLSQEKIDQQFQKILKKALEDDQNELENINKREIELREEIGILRKIQFDSIDYES